MLQRLRELRRVLPPVFWTVWIGTLINRAGGFVVPLLTFYLIGERGLSIGDAGAIVSLFGAGGMVAALVGGVLADVLGRRATMARSLLGGAAIMFGLGAVTEPAAIAALTFALGLVGELYRPAVQAFIADVVPAEHRLRAYGLLYWAINMGFSIAPIAAGLIAGWSYTALFIIDGATMAIYGAIILARVPETRPERAAGDGAVQVGLLRIAADRVFLRFLIFTFLTVFVMYQCNAALSAWMASQGHSARIFGAVIAVNGILIVLFQPTITALVAGHAPTRILAVSSLLVGAGFALHGASALVLVHVAAVVVWTLGEIAAAPTSASVVAQLAEPEARGRYQGLFTMSWGLAAFAGPLVGPRVLEQAGPAALWGGCLAVGVVAAAGFATGRLERG
ncbi:MAG TPA: MFS transporter [Kofleriaceae bacterium]|nr:MFS transporter [Kofleriaceae bacterium]